MPISLTVDSTGTVTPNSQKVNDGDLVQWSLQGGGSSTLTITFGSTTPFSSDPLGSGSGTVQGGIRADAASNHYPYTVSINGNPCAGAPEIVVA